MNYEEIYLNRDEYENIISEIDPYKIHCGFCDSLFNLYAFKNFTICKGCLKNKKTIRMFTDILENIKCNVCSFMSIKGYSYKNNMKICYDCFDRNMTLYNLLDLYGKNQLNPDDNVFNKLFDNASIYFLTDNNYIIPILNINVNDFVDCPEFLNISYDKLLDKKITFISDNPLNNLFRLKELKDCQNIIPFCTNGVKDEYYTYCDVITNQLYSLVVIDSNYTLMALNQYLVHYIYLKKNNNEDLYLYCPKCKNQRCDHKKICKIKSLSYKLYNDSLDVINAIC